MNKRFLLGLTGLVTFCILCWSGSLMAAELPASASGESLNARVAAMQTTLGSLVENLGTTADARSPRAAQQAREEQRQRVLTLQRECADCMALFPAKNHRLFEDMGCELETLKIGLAQADEDSDLRVHLGNAETLVKVLAVQAATLSDGSCREHGDRHGQMASKPCGSCKGQGKDTWGRFCTVCGGDGYVLAPQDAPACGACQGAGKDTWGRVCPGCQGTGWANVDAGNGGHDHDGHSGHGGHGWSLQICGSCKGAGQDTWGRVCTVCGNDGYVAVQGEPHACGNCQGQGKDTWGRVCPGCQGTGWANTQVNPAWGGGYTSTACGNCKGQGKDTWGRICTTCGGDGFVTSPTDQKACALCKGQGKDTWGRLCPACQGNGWAKLIEKPVVQE